MSLDKTEYCVVAEDPLEAAERPKLQYGGLPVKYNPTPKFLGVRFDETLSFAPHVERTVAEFKRRGRISTSGTKSGFSAWSPASTSVKPSRGSTTWRTRLAPTPKLRTRRMRESKRPVQISRLSESPKRGT